MLAKLKALLAECHYVSGDLLKTLVEANYDYVMARASEEMERAKVTIDPKEADERIILAIRLLTLARYKLANNAATPANTRQVRTRKQRGRSVDQPAE